MTQTLKAIATQTTLTTSTNTIEPKNSVKDKIKKVKAKTYLSASYPMIHHGRKQMLLAEQVKHQQKVEIGGMLLIQTF